MRKSLLLIPAAMLLLGATTSLLGSPARSVAAANGSRQTSSPPLTAGTSIPSWGHTSLADLAESMATASQDAHPSKAIYVKSVRGLANAVLNGDVVDGRQIPVYVVVLTGRFTGGAWASVAPGAAVPTGRFLSLVVDARNGRTLDAGISNSLHGSLSHLGSVHSLPLP